MNCEEPDMEDTKSKIIVLIIVVLALASIIGSGFAKKTDVVLYEYTVAEDGTSVTMVAAPTSAFGRARGFQEEIIDGGHYLTFYRTFGFFGFHASEINHELTLSEEAVSGSAAILIQGF